MTTAVILPQDGTLHPENRKAFMLHEYKVDRLSHYEECVELKYFKKPQVSIQVEQLCNNLIYVIHDFNESIANEFKKKKYSVNISLQADGDKC